jgi:hypothetical protein
MINRNAYRNGPADFRAAIAASKAGDALARSMATQLGEVVLSDSPDTS